MPSLSSPRARGAAASPKSDFSRKLPVWYQLAMIWRGEILNGTLAAGARIEPEVQLAARHGVSVMPVRQALKSLEEEGLVSRQRGRGTFVSDNRRPVTGTTSLESLYSREFETPARILERGLVQVPATFRDAFPEDDDLAFVRRLAFHGGRPWSYGTLYFLPSLGARITSALLQKYPLYRVMDEQCGVSLRRSRFRAQASAASADVATHLEIDRFAPVLNLTAVSEDQSGRAVGAFEMAFIGEPYVFGFETDHGGKDVEENHVHI